jgi:hypothetical protein
MISFPLGIKNRKKKPLKILRGDFMKDVQDLRVSQVRIFPVGSIPYEVFSVSENLTQLKDFFSFSNQEVPVPLFEAGAPKVIILAAGQFKHEDKNIIINRLHFDNRKIVLEVVGNSNEADGVFGNIIAHINKISSNCRLDEQMCQLKTQETKCMVGLDIDFWNVFSEEMKRFIQKEAPQSLKYPLRSIEPKNLSFEVAFQQTESLQEDRITLTPKKITIEPQTGIPLSKGIFYTQSPFDSETHLKLIESFEKAFLPKRKKSKDK